MRRLVVFFVRRLKRDPGYDLDPAMPLSAIVSLLTNTLGKALRGYRRRIGFGRAKGVTFIGKHVTLRNKRFIRVGRNFIADDFCEIVGLSKQGIVCGDRVTIGRYALIRPSAQFGGREIGEGLRIGNNSNIGAFGYVGCSGYIQIGDNVMLAPRVSLYAENHNFEATDRTIKQQGVSRAPIIIEDDCWIASHAVILAGVTIGRGSVVAAGSVVTKSMPPYSIIAGVPARVIKSRAPNTQPTIEEVSTVAATPYPGAYGAQG